MAERLGEMRKWRREKIENGSREWIEKRAKSQFEKEDLLRAPPFLESSRSDPAM